MVWSNCIQQYASRRRAWNYNTESILPVTRDFGFSLDQVNWLGIAINLIFLPSSVLIPLICARYGIRATVRTAPAYLTNFCQR